MTHLINLLTVCIEDFKIFGHTALTRLGWDDYR